jgi:predicted thioesterase
MPTRRTVGDEDGSEERVVRARGSRFLRPTDHRPTKALSRPRWRHINPALQARLLSVVSKGLAHGYRVKVRYVVTEDDSANVVGSGDVSVLATPRLIAWMEAETVLAAASQIGTQQTTVGTAVRIDHVKATAVGGAVDVTASLMTHGQARRLTFALTALDDRGQRVAGGEIDRVVVDRTRFLQSLREPPSSAREEPSADTGGSTDEPVGSARQGQQRPGMSLAPAVMFVRQLDRSVEFYRELLGLEVTLRDDTVALLVSQGGSQLYLRSMGPHDSHPVGNIGIQYVIWTAGSEEDLRRCEMVLRGHSRHVSVQTADNFTIVEGRGPDEVPVLITYPGPGRAHRKQILQRIYRW